MYNNIKLLYVPFFFLFPASVTLSFDLWLHSTICKLYVTSTRKFVRIRETKLGNKTYKTMLVIAAGRLGLRLQLAMYLTLNNNLTVTADAVIGEKIVDVADPETSDENTLLHSVMLCARALSVLDTSLRFYPPWNGGRTTVRCRFSHQWRNTVTEAGQRSLRGARIWDVDKVLDWT